MPSRGSITTEDQEFLETWEHISPQQWGVTRLDSRGDEKAEIIRGRRSFKITTEERIITQDRIKDDADDPFLNGSFRPIVVPDSITIETNPNALSDDEITEIFASSDLAFSENLRTIDSVATYRRMLELAEDSDDMTVKRFRALEARLEQVRGTVRIDTNDPRLRRFLQGGVGGGDDAEPTATSGANNPRRQQAGMSSNYR